MTNDTSNREQELILEEFKKEIYKSINQKELTPVQVTKSFIEIIMQLKKNLGLKEFEIFQNLNKLEEDKLYVQNQITFLDDILQKLKIQNCT